MKNEYENILAMYYLESRPTLKIIGARFGISKQRIEQIVIKYGKGKRDKKPQKIKFSRIEKRINKFHSMYKKNEECGCLEWMGSCNPVTGYGVFHFGGELTAHRSAWIIEHGEIPQGMWVLHKCDNPRCVNINHLYIGTPKQNVLDREERYKGIKLKDRPYTNIPFGERISKNDKEQT